MPCTAYNCPDSTSANVNAREFIPTTGVSFEKQVIDEFRLEITREALPFMEQKFTNSDDPFTRTTNYTNPTAGNIEGCVDKIFGTLTYSKRKLAEDIPYAPGCKDTLTNAWRDEQPNEHGGTSKETTDVDCAAEEIFKEPQAMV